MMRRWRDRFKPDWVLIVFMILYALGIVAALIYLTPDF